MLNTPLALICSPLLIAQGLYTQWKTPQLPEAQGARIGQSGYGKPLRLLIVGDSAAAGVGAMWQTEALSGQLMQILQHEYACQWAVHAQSGLTTIGLCKILSDQVQQPFDVAIVSIGVNDILKRVTVAQWTQQLSQLHQCLAHQFSVAHVIFTAIPPMGQFPALPQPLRYFLGKMVQQMNQQLMNYCDGQADCHVLALNWPLEKHYMARDGFHPSPQAYQRWAQHAADLIKQLDV